MVFPDGISGIVDMVPNVYHGISWIVAECQSTTITTKTILLNAMQNIISVPPKFILVTRTYHSSMVTLLICTLAIHPFIWGGADVAGDCLWSNDMHITLMCYQLSYPYIFCTLYP